MIARILSGEIKQAGFLDIGIQIQRIVFVILNGAAGVAEIVLGLRERTLIVGAVAKQKIVSRLRMLGGGDQVLIFIVPTDDGEGIVDLSLS